MRRANSIAACCSNSKAVGGTQPTALPSSPKVPCHPREHTHRWGSDRQPERSSLGPTKRNNSILQIGALIRVKHPVIAGGRGWKRDFLALSCRGPTLIALPTSVGGLIVRATWQCSPRSVLPHYPVRSFEGAQERLMF